MSRNDLVAMITETIEIIVVAMMDSICIQSEKAIASVMVPTGNNPPLNI